MALKCCADESNSEGYKSSARFSCSISRTSLTVPFTSSPLWVRLPRIASPKETRCENLEQEAVRASSKSAEIFRWWSSVTRLYRETCMSYRDTECTRLPAAMFKLPLVKVCVKYLKLAQGQLNLKGKFWKFSPLDMPSTGNHLYRSYISWF